MIMENFWGLLGIFLFLAVICLSYFLVVVGKNAKANNRELKEVNKEFKKQSELIIKLNQDYKSVSSELVEKTITINKYKEQYAGAINIDELVSEKTKLRDQLEQDIIELQVSYVDKKQMYDRLLEQLAIYDEEIELIELGFYKPHFDFDTSEEYKNALSQVREKQKTMLKEKAAITCITEWTVGGSKAEGRKLSERAIRLTARAFNNECDAAIANVEWNNVIRMDERIQKAFDNINKLNETNTVVISASYLMLKLDELRLAYEYKDKRRQEKEEQAEIRRQMKEELKLEQEAQAAQKEEEKYQKLIAKAQAEAAKSFGKDMTKLNQEIEELEAKLAEAHAKNERALSMAQQTKAGHVYIISNVGSFGEDIYKIGMTRRLEPVDRVNELGDASVPFYFDIHAMIYSENAPAMENSLHRAFREFFVDPLDQTTIVIHVLPHRTFPLGQFNNEGIRRLLSWILLDKNARKSYESIAHYFKLEAKQFEEKTSWQFHFTPPQLINISLKMIGRFDSTTNEYIAFEITDLHNIKTSLPLKVLYESPEFKSGKSTGFGGGSSSSNQGGDDPSVDDDVEGDSNSKLVQIEIPQTSLSFSNPSETRKVVKKKTKGSGGHDDATEYEEVGVGTDEPTINGNGSQGDFNGLEDDSDVIALYMQRFEAFKLLVKQIALKHRLKYEEKLHYLQKVGR